MGKGGFISDSTTTLVLGAGVIFLLYKSDFLGNIGTGTGKAIEGLGEIGAGLGTGFAGLGQGMAGIGAGINNLGLGFEFLGAGLGTGFAGLGVGVGSGISKLGDIGTGLGMGFQFLGAGGGNMLTDLSIPKTINALYGKEVPAAFTGSDISKIGTNNFLNTMNFQQPVDVISQAKTSTSTKPSWATSTNPFTSSGSSGNTYIAPKQPSYVSSPTSPTGYTDRLGQPVSVAPSTKPSWATSTNPFITKK